MRRKNSGNSGTEYRGSRVVSSPVYCYEDGQRSGVTDERSAEKKVGLEE